MHARWREAGFFLLVASSLIPLWIVKRPPSQDWPQHVAAVRVLIDHADPALRLADAVEFDLTRTQYIGFYLLAAALAKVLGASVAVKLVISASLFAIPYAVRALLRVSGGDERYAPFAVAVTYTAHVLMGFLSFLSAVPVALFSLHAAARYRLEPTKKRALILGLMFVLLFYLHILPFAFALCVAFAIIWGAGRAARYRAALALMPSLLLVAIWAGFSAAGSATAGVMADALLHRANAKTSYDHPLRTLLELPQWLTDILPGYADVVVLGAAVLVMVLAAWRLREPAERPQALRWLRLAPLFAIVFTFALPARHGWIWPIAGRFPYLCVLLLPLLLPRMRARAGDVCAALLGALAIAHVALVGVAFRRVEKNEFGGFEGALAAIPQGSRVLGLMYFMTSSYVLHHVFMHAHAYAQAEHGGVLMYSFAKTPQSPFTYKLPPEGPPDLALGLGWSPQHADMALSARYFEYVIAHGYAKHLNSVRIFYEPIYDENGWQVYRRL